MSTSTGHHSEVVDILTLCRSFPPLPQPAIERPHILAELDEFFSRGIDLVTIEGEEGKGKTTLLAQFAIRHPTRSIGLFARPTSRHTYDPLYLLTDLCEQIHWLVYRKLRPETGEPPNDGEYRLLLNHLEGRARREANPYYFLVDGLEEIPEEDTAVRDELLDLLPFGRSYFHFLYAGRPGALARLPERARYTLQPAQYPLTRFSLEEASRYLDDLGVDEGDARQLLELTAGLPGHLAIVRRMLVDGLPIERLMTNTPKELSGLFDYQWEAIAHATPGDADLLQDLLAILAHDRGHHTMRSLAGLTGERIERIKSLLAPLTFIRIDSGDSGVAGRPVPDDVDGMSEVQPTDEGRQEVSLIPEAFRAYAAHRLAAREHWVRERVVDDLTARPQSDDALTRLPASLAALGRHDALLQYLSPDYFVELIGRQRTLSTALAVVSLGIREAQSERRDVDLTRLSLTRGLLLELGRGRVDTEEVEAHMALGDEDGALALALSAPLAEDRLELLATIAKVRRLGGDPPSPEIQGQLEQLAAQVDPDALGKRVGQVAVSLLFSLPDVALRFLERAREWTVTDRNENAKDRAIALDTDSDVREWFDVAEEALGGGHIEGREHLELLQASSTDPFAKRLTSVMSAVYGKHSAEEALEEVADLDRLQDQVFVLREWLRRNRRRPDAARVVEMALDRLLLHSTEEMPNAAAFHDIAGPLPWLPDLAEVARLVGRFDTFAELIEQRGPSRDYVRLQLRLARAECRYDTERAYSRLLEVWYYADARTDLVERAASVAHLVAAFEPISETALAAGQRSPVPAKDVAEIDASLDEYVNQLLRTSADQYHATRGVIRALAPRYPKRALTIAARLNTLRRRQVATLDAVRPTLSTFHTDTATDAAESLEAAMQTLVGTVQGDIALLLVAEGSAALAGAGRADERLAGNAEAIFSTEQALNTESMETHTPTAVNVALALAHFLPAYERCKGMIGGRRRARSLVLWEAAFRRLTRRLGEVGDELTSSPVTSGSRPPRGPITKDRLRSLVPQAAEIADAAWDDIALGWRKVTLGFELAHVLAPVEPDRARAFLARAEAARRDLRIAAASAAMPYAACVDLSVRAYIGLLDQGIALDEDLARLRRVIDVLPGPGDRAANWAGVAVRCFLHKRDDLGRKIVVDHIHPLLALVSGRDALVQRGVIAAAAPALYLAHQETAREWIRRIQAPVRDAIYAEIAYTLVKQVPPGDPFFPGMSRGRPLEWTEAIDICRLIDDIEFDVPLYSTIEALADCIVAGRQIGKLSRDQQRQIAERVRVAIGNHLPDPRNITHEGYKLIALAQAARMDPTTSTRREVWTDLAARARAIPNDSDRAFVLAHLAATTPSPDDHAEWLSVAENIIGTLPVRLNRVENYLALAQLVLQGNRGAGAAALARQWLNSAMQTAIEDPEDTSTHPAQRRIIDLAYQFDEPLARELARRVDDDPARLMHRLQSLELKKSLVNSTSSTGGNLVSRSNGPAGGADERDRLHAWVQACWLHLGAQHADRVPTIPNEHLRQPLAEVARLPLSESFPVYALSIENSIRRLGGTNLQARMNLRPLFEAMVEVTELVPQLVEDASARATRAARVARRPRDDGEGWFSELIRAGQRVDAEQMLRAWCAAHRSPYVKLSDRFFTPEQLDWIRLLAEAMPPGCQITVLTSRQGQENAHVTRPWAQSYKLHWRLRVADQDAPPTEIVIIGTEKEGIAPFHDRRIVVAGAGLKIGTSLNAIGGASDTTIDALTPEEVEETERNLDEWARGGAWVYKGERLLRTVFRLDDPED